MAGLENHVLDIASLIRGWTAMWFIKSHAQSPCPQCLPLLNRPWRKHYYTLACEQMKDAVDKILDAEETIKKLEEEFFNA